LPEFLKGRAAQRQGQTEAARQHWEAALRADARYLPPLMALVELEFAQGQTDAARGRLQEALKRDPNNAQLLLALAQVQWRSAADKSEVVDTLRRAVRSNPNAAEARLQLIDLGLTLGDYGLALSEAQQGTSALPDHPGLLDRLGHVQQLSGSYQQAANAYGRLASLLPKEPMPHLRLAELNLDMGRPEPALQHARKAWELAPESPAAARSVAMMAVKASRPDEANAVARSFLKRTPAMAWRLEGDIARELGQFAAAEAALRKSLALAPDPQTAQLLVQVLHQGGRKEDAERFTDEWIKRHPGDLALLLTAAYFNEQARDLDVAERRLRTALAAAPDNPDVLNNLASVLVQGNRAEALDFAMKANRLAPNRPMYMDTLSGALAVAGKLPQALAVQARAVAYGPDLPNHRLTLARLQLKSGKTDEAAANIERLLQLGPAFAGHADVKELAARLRRPA
jgi:cellulose synthase operon protein C